MQDTEIFYPAKGLENYYEITQSGIIRSITRRIKLKGNGSTIRGGKEIKTFIVLSGYVQVSIQISEIKFAKRFSIHRLVAETFIPNPNNYPCINHKNRIRHDNRVENLEWCTYQMNNKHIYDTGTISAKRKLNNDAVIDIFTNCRLGKKMDGNRNGNVSEFAKKYQINKSCIYDIVNGITYKSITNLLHQDKDNL